MINTKIKVATVLISLTLVLVIATGCNSKKGIESSELSEKVENKTNILGVEDIDKEDISEEDKSIEKELKDKDKSQNLEANTRDFSKKQLKEAKQRMKESFDIKIEIREKSDIILAKEDLDSLRSSNSNLSKYNNELELQFNKYPNLTQEDYDKSINIIDSMINEINNMNKIQNNSDEFKGILVNTIEGLATTKNYILQSRNKDIALQNAVLVPELLRNCIDIYNDNMADILESINDYVYSE